MGPVSGLSLDGTRSALPAQLQAEPKQLGVGGDESGGVGEVVAVPRWDPLLGKVAHRRCPGGARWRTGRACPDPAFQDGRERWRLLGSPDEAANAE